MKDFLREGGPDNSEARQKAEAEAKLRRDEVTRMESESPMHPDVLRVNVSRRSQKPSGPVNKK